MRLIQTQMESIKQENQHVDEQIHIMQNKCQQYRHDMEVNEKQKQRRLVNDRSSKIYSSTTYFV
jgi:hypothetical protein